MGGRRRHPRLAPESLASKPGSIMLTLKVPDMSCGHCVATITKCVKQADSAAQVVADVDAKTVQVETRLADAALLEMLANIGYPATRV
jgi:copper chaperone